MKQVSVVLKNEAGLHARPASMFTRTAAKYQCNIKVVKGEQEVNPKNILSLITMNVRKGESITIIADGIDENEAVAALQSLVENNFPE
ncbi:HPr family phosphocarrier protein [Defluviitalea saccharophila]|uniref:Phosphocarrier protein HPr n=1 Tax=Defluviitalea saccharophila TaxID=879970 RepID=A0ABZ2Y4Q7_9FIRM|nr:HPr family phosphocarrier protein [Candidatus Epulonipiscium sp.]